MDLQKNIFIKTEGDQWFIRNKEKYNLIKKENEIIRSFQSIGIIPKKVLEIGCSNGSVLNAINKKFGSECYGIDPSSKAVKNGQKLFPNINLKIGTAEKLPFRDGSFDMIIFGFCLYLCDRKDLFKIAYEADRCLRNGGFITIKDFYSPASYKNKYVHKKGIFSYKMDYSKMFGWNPFYCEVFDIILENEAIPDNKVSIAVLKKDENNAYPQFK